MARRVEYTRSALKELAGVPSRDRIRIERAVNALGTDAESGLDIRKLVGIEDGYRMRVGDWRILFAREGGRIIIITAVRHRREAYR